MTRRDTSGSIMRTALAVLHLQLRLDYAGGIHGLPHWSRVWFHGQRLAAAMDVNPAVLAWFAHLHDSQRHGDASDPRHGPRAADFALRLWRERAINELPAIEFEHLCEAIRLDSDGHVASAPAIIVCCGADRLDLGRVWIAPRADRLCTPFAKQPREIRQAMRLSQGIRPQAVPTAPAPGAPSRRSPGERPMDAGAHDRHMLAARGTCARDRQPVKRDQDRYRERASTPDELPTLCPSRTRPRPDPANAPSCRTYSIPTRSR